MFSNLFNERKGFKYQIAVKVLSKKCKLNGEMEFAPIHLNSTTIIVIRHKFNLQNVFQEILYLTDVWIHEGSGWIVESIESQYINISIYQPLSGSSYINLPVELRNPRKGLINIRDKDQKKILWCHISLLILQNCLTRLWMHLCTPKLIYDIKIKIKQKHRRVQNVFKHPGVYSKQSSRPFPMNSNKKKLSSRATKKFWTLVTAIKFLKINP